MAGHTELLDDQGRQRVVRHGFLREREVMTGIGKVPVRVPRLSERQKTALSMVYKPMMSAQKKWRKRGGKNRLPEIIQGVELKGGIKQHQNAA